MAKEVKLSDIAEKLGISTVSVSKALSGQKGVSEKTRLEVKKLASDMGYVSLTEARMLAERKSHNIGVLVGAKYFNQAQSFYWLMYQELATKAVTKNSFTMLEVVQDEEENSNSIPRLLNGNRIDGLVIIGLMKEEYLQMVKANTTVPIVYLDFYGKDDSTDAVVTDNYLGMYRMTQYLCSMGHRKIGYVGTLFTTDSITDRYFGYCKALSENGIAVKNGEVINDRFEDTGSMAGFSYDLPAPEDMPTAFACNCDVTAVGLIEKLHAAGYRVPEDISVVGFDDYVMSNTTNVNLTTYAVDVKEMARKAVKILLKRMAGEIFDRTVTVVEGRIVIRESVKNINQ